MLMGGKVILNRLDYRENFDVNDALASPALLAEFARYHLALDPLSRHCADVLACPDRSIASENDFWKGVDEADRKDIPRWARNVATEAFAMYKHAPDADASWARECVLAVASTILAGKKTFVMPERHTEGGARRIDLSGDRISIMPGYTYECAYMSPRAVEKADIRTIQLNIRAAGSGEAVIRVGDKTYTRAPGDVVYLNVLDDKVVAVLPDEDTCPDGVLRRDCAAKCVTFNGMRTPVPFEATNFAALSEGRYLYVKDRKLGTVGVGSNEISPVAMRSACVGVAIAQGSVYILNPRGIVKDSTGATPPEMQHIYTCLDAALGGEIQ